MAKATQQRVTLVFGACAVLLISVGYTSRIYRAGGSGTASALTQAETSGCTPIMKRTLCKEYTEAFLLDGIKGFSQADINCIKKLANDKGIEMCKRTIRQITEALMGQTPDRLAMDPVVFNRLAALTGVVETVDPETVHSNKPKPIKYVPKPKPKTDGPAPEEDKQPDKSKYAYLEEYGWSLDDNGKFNYHSGGKTMAADYVPDGCHEYAAVDLCFTPNQGDRIVLRKVRNMQLSEVECIGYLCRTVNKDKCCKTLESVKVAIDGKNWMDVAEYEDNFEKLLKATGEYLP
eukprot:gnl/MRDRNA2_/MRDRNA2_98470_c0_seq1.p1 gnl/MRDRNA2_/MRDRNA2_98470_c0~~gnl/MRDRNA2_/MRDRNA2_98470_c0_seq1.p1  ORF type:complete len:316 (+),score=67.33 gnl/MRDRNA2_/MRDRNA2_98470_c0_seq1:79-948(+)